MSEKQNVIAEPVVDTLGENESILKLELADSFVFDEVEVKEIIMEGMMDMTAADLCAIDMQMIARGYSGIRMEATKQYAMFVAARINKKPWEFCDRMKARDAIRLRDMVSAFFTRGVKARRF